MYIKIRNVYKMCPKHKSVDEIKKKKNSKSKLFKMSLSQKCHTYKNANCRS